MRVEIKLNKNSYCYDSKTPIFENIIFIIFNNIFFFYSSNIFSTHQAFFDTIIYYFYFLFLNENYW